MKVMVVGCGRIGSPLLTWLAHRNQTENCFDAINGIDVNPEITDRPVTARFNEIGWRDILNNLKYRPWILTYDSAQSFGTQDVVIVTCGTPVDNNQNPNTDQLTTSIQNLLRRNIINENTLVILRSTLFPGGTKWLRNHIYEKYDIKLKIIMAPERIAEGYTFAEIDKVPQIIGIDDEGSDEATAALTERAKDFFQKFGSSEMIILDSHKGGSTAAELAKLMCNTWRYVQFSTANEFAIIADELNVEYDFIREACNKGYWRAGIPKAGLNVGGPCLGKDAKILSAFTKNATITESAYSVAEKTPIYFLNKEDVKGKTVGVLGLAFKRNSDNKVNSLSYKLIKHLEIRETSSIKVHDPVIKHRYSASLEDVIACNIVFVMTEHNEYSNIVFPPTTKVIRL